jgi:glycosyltransferase involved in cell wall biosynthesis
VGRLVASKGLEHLVLAMPLVIREVPDARLIIVGRGSFRPHLESLVDRLGLGSSVEFAGFVGEDEKIDLISRSHVLVHPSMREGWATPVTEANACGVIAVGSDTEGVRSAIVAGVTGLLFRYGDSKGIAECMVKVLKDKEMRELMEANALRFSSQFSLSLTKRMASTVILNHAERNSKSPGVSTGKDLR